MKTIVTIFIIFCSSYLSAQTILSPVILEVKEDDQIATIYWNSKTDNYSENWDPWKQQGICSYLVEWGKVSNGFTHKMSTPYRAIQCQPLEPGEIYQARIYAVNNYGVKSSPSATVQFQHNEEKVNAMRSRLNGFFDDFNLPMGAFDETKWNQAYSGCAKIGYLSQHINNQFHAHNVLASDHCDRGIASSRARNVFDFTNRTGVIEFDLDGSKLGRQRWYLDLSPASRKRDLTGHVAIDDSAAGPQADPPFLLRIAEIHNRILIHLANEDGVIIRQENMYNNDVCGLGLEYCPDENLTPIPNVRKHWKIELSKTHIRIFIEDILVVDGSLITEHTPNGLPYEVAQVNWLFFSYNTTKENLPMSMVHWDNFGFDAPQGWQQTEIIHNYTDGFLGTNSPRAGNDAANGMEATSENPAQSIVPIPDNLLDNNGNPPLKAELMFTLQGGSYEWNSNNFIQLNNAIYPFSQPISTINNLPLYEIVNTIKPHSVIIELNPADLITGNNQIIYHLNNAKILNVHIEMTYPMNSAPNYTAPADVHTDHIADLMAFNQHNNIGPNINIDRVNGIRTWRDDEYQTEYNDDGSRMLVKQTPVSGNLTFDLLANSNAQLIAKATATGISHYKVFINEKVVQTVYVNAQTPASHFQHFNLSFDTRLLTNGMHKLYVEAYDIYNRPSVFDLFEKHVSHGEYLPIAFTVNNASTIDCPLSLTDNEIVSNNAEIELGSYFANSNITSSATISVGNTVTFYAGENVTLNSGFKVQQGGNFLVRMEACGF